MTALVFCLEEPSAREMLQGLLPRLFPADALSSVHYLVFQGKRDLLKRLQARLKGWQDPRAAFVVLCDQDSENCRDVKQRLAQKAAGRANVLIRIACHELESWYLGDLAAVEQAFSLQGIARQQDKEKFRDPDYLGNPVQELTALTASRYQKISGSRALGRCLRPEHNRSQSFQAFVCGLRRIVYADNAER